jgi:hypothetical protein
MGTGREQLRASRRRSREARHHPSRSADINRGSRQLDGEIGRTNMMIQEVYPYRPRVHFELVDHAPEDDLKDGFLPISDRPGLGVALMANHIERFRWAECRM